MTLCRCTRRRGPTSRTSAATACCSAASASTCSSISALFRKTPRLLDRLWDSPRSSGRSRAAAVSTDARLLGDLTISMLQGERGVLRKEFDKLVDWMRDEPLPDVINLPNSLLDRAGGAAAEALERPVCCTLQGEELFLNGLVPPYRERALALIRQQVRQVDRFIAVSDYCAHVHGRAAGHSALPASTSCRSGSAWTATNGGDGRAATCSGRLFRARRAGEGAARAGRRLRAVPAAHRDRARCGSKRPGTWRRPTTAIWTTCAQLLERRAWREEFRYRGAVDRAGKLAFLRELDVLSVPATYDEPKGMFLLEAMASGVPVVQPRRGGFIEIVEKTGGGLLVEPDSPEQLADGLYTLWSDRGMRPHAGRARVRRRARPLHHRAVGEPAARRLRRAGRRANRRSARPWPEPCSEVSNVSKEYPTPRGPLTVLRRHVLAGAW